MAKKRKFNVVDAVILIIVVAIVGVAAFLLFRETPKEVSSNTKVEYVVEFRQVRNEFTDNFSIGDRVVDSVAKYHIGQITAVSYVDAVYDGNDMTTGKASAGTYPGYSDVKITVIADASYGATGRYVIDGGYDISVGTKVYVRIPNYNGMGYCVSINEVEEAK